MLTGLLAIHDRDLIDPAVVRLARGKVRAGSWRGLVEVSLVDEREQR